MVGFPLPLQTKLLNLLKKDIPEFKVAHEDGHYSYQDVRGCIVKTNGDGNCLFNAVALGLRFLVKRGTFLEFPLFFLRMRSPMDFLFMIKNLSSNGFEATKTIQLSLAPLLRALAIERDIKLHDELYSSSFEARMRHLYREHKNGYEDVEYLLEKRFISDKLKDERVTEDIFMTWWFQEGKDQYLNHMKGKPKGVGDCSRWVGENELVFLPAVLK